MMANLFQKNQNTENIEVVLYMITEANLIDFCVNNGSLVNSKFLIFTFFDKIDFLELEWK